MALKLSRTFLDDPLRALQMDSALHLFFAHLIDGAPIPDIFEQSTFLEDGLELSSYLTQEQELFKNFNGPFGLTEGWSIRAEHVLINQSDIYAETQLLNHLGHVVYEWPYRFAKNGRLIGNQSFCQIVSKIRSENQQFCRALAFKSQKKILRLSPNEGSYVIESETYLSSDEEYQGIGFSFPDDDLSSFWIAIRIRYADSIETKPVWLRGFDRPGFIPPSFRKESSQYIWNCPLIWSLTVKDTNESVQIIPHPSSPQKIEGHWACLTDAYDHDWILKD
jgi:hypothetical protein